MGNHTAETHSRKRRPQSRAGQDAPPAWLAMDAHGLNVRYVDYSFSSAYLALSDASSPSSRSHDHNADSPSQYDSSMPASPTAGGFHASLQSPASTGSLPSPSYRQLSPSSAAAAGTRRHPSSGLDADGDASSPRASRQGRKPRCSSAQSGRDYPVCCLYPGCNVKPFKRRADLDRHYKHRHAADSQKASFSCDYPRCSRRREPFHRLDHFRDHLREYHKEDIEKRGGRVNEEWLEGRRVSSSWWRCSKCLKRIYVEQSGYDCPHCKSTCQAKRKEARRRS
ncbi:uncharacterized protein UV8b_07542 [Ustilaginoidea virens]|uniref:Egg shell protein n=1 Tax=Ustilaginoidea virens TaxID=1159556 RepID=A0A8E5MKX3_USTVR|nr:uncharacterized protein UV8b_07542 [Ustilaginoidea virens]QUC23301.1 hypothetical protein UV8b_07542 [Ustilaginoidea virens]